MLMEIVGRGLIICMVFISVLVVILLLISWFVALKDIFINEKTRKTL